MSLADSRRTAIPEETCGINYSSGLSNQEQLAQFKDFIVVFGGIDIDTEFFPNRQFYVEAQKLIVSFGFQKIILSVT